MKLNKEMVHNPYLSRVTAIILAVIILLQLGAPVTMAESHSLLDKASPVVFYGGAPIDDGMEIPAGSPVYTYYSFEASRSALSEMRETVSLPEGLLTSGDLWALLDESSFTVWGDSESGYFEVGALDIDDKGNVTVSFLDMLPGGDAAAGGVTGYGNAGDEEEDENTIGEANELNTTGNAAMGVTTGEDAEDDALKDQGGDDKENTFGGNTAPNNTETGSGSNTPNNLSLPDANKEGAWAIDPDELIAVDFIIPAVVDVSGLEPDENGCYTLLIKSGGRDVMVTVAPGDGAQQVEQAPFDAAAIPAELPGTYDFDPNAAAINTTILTRADGTPLGDDDEVSSADTLLMKYYFDITPLDAAEIAAQVEAMEQAGLLPSAADPSTAAADGYYIYQIKLPTGLRLPPGILSSKDMEIVVVEQGTEKAEVYGELFYVDGDRNTVYIVFKNGAKEFWNDSENYATKIEGYIWVACVLDMDEYQVGQLFDIEVESGTTIRLNVTDDRDPHKAVKTVAYDANKSEFTWKVTYTVGETGVAASGLNFLDEFSGPHAYVGDSLDVDIKYKSNAPVVHIDVADTALGSNTDLTNGKIEYVLDSNTYPLVHGDIVTFTYNTKLTSDAYTLAEVTADNQANITYDIPQGASVPSNPESYTVDPDDLKLLEKQVQGAGGTWYNSGTIGSHPIYVNPISHEIKWQVIVSAKGLQIESGGLKLSDTLSKELDLTGVSYTSKNADGSVGADSGSLSYTTQDHSDGTTTFTVDIPEIGGSLGNYYAEYTITYTTRIKDEYFFDHPYISISNEASLDVTPVDPTVVIPDGYLSDRLPGPVPGIDVDTNIINKSGTYSDATGLITWTVTLNPYHLDVKSGTFTDAISDIISQSVTAGTGAINITGGQEFVDMVTFDNAPNSPDGIASWRTTPGFDSRGAQAEILTVTVENLGTNSFTFRFTTKPTDEALFQNGNRNVAATNVDYNKLTFTNTGEFNGVVNNGVTTQPVSGEDTGAAKVPSIMMTKEGAGYDYDAQTITWKITVNENKVAMKSARLTDILITGNPGASNRQNLAGFNEAELKAGITVKDADPLGQTYVIVDDYEVHYNAATGDLTIIFLEQSGTCILDKNTVIVTIQTKVDVDDTAVFKNGKTPITISNTARLSSDDYIGIDIPGTGTQPITNEMVRKGSGTGYDPATNTITYSVNINPNELYLVDCTLTDTLQKHLKLDVDSVKLYTATCSDGGKVTGGAQTFVSTGVEVDPSKYSWTYDHTDNIFTVTMPNGSDSYILEYACIVAEYTPTVDNTVRINGIGAWRDAPSKVTTAITADSYAITHLREASLSISILKVDSVNKLAINGLNFRLYMMDLGEDGMIVDSGETGNRKYVDTGVMNADGKLNFYYLKPDRPYKLEEIVPYDPDGNIARVIAINGTSLGDDSIPLDEFIFVPSTSGGITGYAKSGDEYALEIKNNNLSISISNDPVVTILFDKVRSGAANVGLRGARFRITEQAPYIGSTPYTKDVVSGNGGLVTFTDLPIGANGSVYTIIETAAPSGYVRDTTEYILRVNRNRTYTIENPAVKDALGNNKIVYSSFDAYPNRWKVENTYTPSDSRDRNRPLYEPNVTPRIPPYLIPVEPYYPGNTLVPSTNENVYIEIDENGNAVGEWRLVDTEDGPEWVFHAYSSSTKTSSPATGDNTQMLLWALLFCAAGAGLSVLTLMKRKSKTKRAAEGRGSTHGQ